MTPFARLVEAVVVEGAACLIRVAASEGSVPRDADAWLVLRPSGDFHGTIGGGALEWQALAQARGYLAGPAHAKACERQTVALGPGLGQCCGGQVTLQFERFDGTDLSRLQAWAAAPSEHFHAVAGDDGRVARRPADGAPLPAGGWVEDYRDRQTSLLLFGAGHVARALVLALATLPFQIRWTETRDDAFPAHVPRNATCTVMAAPAQALASVSAGSFVLVMTHSHALDLDIVAAALRQPACAYVGLIGSQTKRARFAAQLARAGFAPAEIDRLVCPIGLPGLPGKQPAIIAASVAADLLLRRAQGDS